MLGPQIVAAGPIVQRPLPFATPSLIRKVTDAEGKQVVDDLQAKGVDFITVGDTLTRDAYFGIASESKRLGLPFAGHLPVSVTALEATNAGQRSIEHFGSGFRRPEGTAHFGIGPAKDSVDRSGHGRAHTWRSYRLMPAATLSSAAPRRARSRRGRTPRAAAFWRLIAPLPIRIVVGTVLLVTVWAAVNWIVQVARKPTELLFPVSESLGKAPEQTWRQYGALFAEHSTTVITPELLAALAQVEGSGNPVARTYWRWRLSWNPFEVYRPASSAVGMFQITDATFAEARRYCIHDHVVVEDGPWYDPHSCWFNALYTRVVPAHAMEMTAALLDRTVARILTRNRVATASLQQRQNLAATIHLCGEGVGDGYARQGFRFRAGQRCGDHDPRRYLAQVNALKSQFARLAAAD